MQITINVSEEGKVATEIQGAKTTDESVVYSSPGPGVDTFPISEVPEGQPYDAGAAPIAFEESTTPSETTATTESNDLDGGRAPQS